MGYMHINNLYKDTTILLFKECWALEKIHGTSAHITWQGDDKKIVFFSGGAKYEHFLTNALGLVCPADYEYFTTLFEELGHDEVTVYGEAYGGKMQGMKETYGSELCFIAFDVKIGNTWLSVENAKDVAHKLDL